MEESSQEINGDKTNDVQVVEVAPAQREAVEGVRQNVSIIDNEVETGREMVSRRTNTLLSDTYKESTDRRGYLDIIVEEHKI